MKGSPGVAVRALRELDDLDVDLLLLLFEVHGHVTITPRPSAWCDLVDCELVWIEGDGVVRPTKLGAQVRSLAQKRRHRPCT